MKMKFKKLLQNRWNHLIIIALITILTYINILQNGFAFDDKDFFLEWPQIKSEKGLGSYLSMPGLLSGDLPIDHRGVYRPLRSIYYLLSYNIWGENPFGYHLQAIIVHTLIVLIIYLITEIIAKKRLIAFIVALIFATHPIHIEAVTFATASMDTLGILFFFLSFYCYLKMQHEKKKKKIYLVASLIYGAFAFLTYEVTLVLPLLIILHNLYANNYSFKSLLSKINIYKYFFLELTGYFILRYAVLGIGNRADYLGAAWIVNANAARVNLPEILKNYLSWLIWPVNQNVSPTITSDLLLGMLYILDKIDPTQNLISLSARISILFPFFYFAVTAGIIYVLFKKHRLVIFSLFWFIITLIPTANIIPQGQAQAERFLYIPSFGFALLLGILYYNLTARLKKAGNKRILLVLPVFFLLLISFYSYYTIKKNFDWKNNKTLWEAAMKANPENPIPYGALGVYFAKEEKYEESKNYYLKGLELEPDHEKMNADLGLVYEKLGQKDKAIAQYKNTLKINPKYYFAHVYLGNLYQSDGKSDIAEDEYKTALEIKKNDWVLLTYAGDNYYNQQKYSEALNLYHQAINLNPYSALLYFKSGRTYLKRTEYEPAIENFNKALELEPKLPEIYQGLSELYIQKEDKQTAVKILEEGIKTTGDSKLSDELKRIKEDTN